MRGQTNHVGGALMVFAGIAFTALFTVASASDRTLNHYWHSGWFILLVGFFGVMAVAGLWIVLSGALPWVPPKSWTSSHQPTTETTPEADLAPQVDSGFPLHGLELKEAWHFHDDDGDHDLGNDFIVVEMRYTNKESDRVNLNAEMYHQTLRYGQVLGGLSKMYPRTKNLLREQLQFPLEVGPRSTVTGLLVFHADSLSYTFYDDFGVTPRWETKTTLVLEEYVSSSQLELAVPFAARKRTSRQEVVNLLTSAIEQGRELHERRVATEEAWKHWLSDHGEWRELVNGEEGELKMALPAADYHRVNDMSDLPNSVPAGEFDYNADHARSRVYIDRRLKNLVAVLGDYREAS